jgi:hypothetical protein
MGAVAAYAESVVNDPTDKRQSPPPILAKAFEIERWGMPNAGGTLDQPAGLLQKVSYALSIYRTWSEAIRAEHRGRAAAFRKSQTPETRRLIYDIQAALSEYRKVNG